MKFWAKLKETKRLHEEARRRSEAIRENVEQALPEVERESEVAKALLVIATKRAEVLKAHDERNHYSESLTYAMRGELA